MLAITFVCTTLTRLFLGHTWQPGRLGNEYFYFSNFYNGGTQGRRGLAWLTSEPTCNIRVHEQSEIVYVGKCSLPHGDPPCTLGYESLSEVLQQRSLFK